MLSVERVESVLDKVASLRTALGIGRKRAMRRAMAASVFADALPTAVVARGLHAGRLDPIIIGAGAKLLPLQTLAAAAAAGKGYRREAALKSLLGGLTGDFANMPMLSRALDSAGDAGSSLNGELIAKALRDGRNSAATGTALRSLAKYKMMLGQ